MTNSRAPAHFASLIIAALISNAWVGTNAYASNNFFKVYIGAAYGHADVTGTMSTEAFGAPISFDAGHSAYQIAAGARFVSLLGAEIDYLDLGSAPATLRFPPPGTVTDMQASQKGEAAFAVLYLPVPVVDIYLKAGVARMTSKLSGALTSPGCDPGLPCACPIGLNGPSCSFTYRGPIDTTSSAFAAGAGLQWEFGNWAVRGEYERFAFLGAHPSLASIGVTWSFL